MVGGWLVVIGLSKIHFLFDPYLLIFPILIHISNLSILGENFHIESPGKMAVPLRILAGSDGRTRSCGWVESRTN